MTIQNLLKPRLIELGKIKIGGKSEQERTTQRGNKWRAPVSWDHFAITTMQRNERGDLIPDDDLMQRLAESHGDEDGKLRELPVTVLSDDVAEILQCRLLWYSGKRVSAWSDGEQVTWYADRRTGKELQKPITEPWREEYRALADRNGARLFKLHAVLNCVIAAGEARWGGVYKFRTTSEITAEQLYGGLLHIHQLTGGVLRGLPLRLVIRPMEVAPEGKAKTIHVVHVELRGPDLQQIQQQALQLAQTQLATARQQHAARLEYLKLLRPPGEDEDPEEGADVAGEFQPGEANADEPKATEGRTVDDEPGSSAPAACDAPDDDTQQRADEWRRLFADASTEAELQQLGRDLANDEAKGSPVRAAVEADFRRRLGELRATAEAPDENQEADEVPPLDSLDSESLPDSAPDGENNKPPEDVPPVDDLKLDQLARLDEMLAGNLTAMREGIAEAQLYVDADGLTNALRAVNFQSVDELVQQGKKPALANFLRAIKAEVLAAPVEAAGA